MTGIVNSERLKKLYAFKAASKEAYMLSPPLFNMKSFFGLYWAPVWQYSGEC